MQFSQKTFGSQNAIKELYRQYSITFKNTESDRNKIMTQSSNVPFNKINNAFNSSTNVQNYPLEGFKNSQVKSIIEKLMQPRQGGLNAGFVGGLGVRNDQEFNIMGDLNLAGLNEKQALLPLSQTQKKIYFQIINLITQIDQITLQTQKQSQTFTQLKQSLKKQGIQFPQIQQKKNLHNQSPSLYQFSKQQLENMFQQNQNLQSQISKLTKQLTNQNEFLEQNKMIGDLEVGNRNLVKEIGFVKGEIFNTGEFDEDEINQLKSKIEGLERDIYQLEQKRSGKINIKDAEWIELKSQNQRLRQKTVQLLRTNSSQPQINQRKYQMIQILKQEQQNKLHYAQQINSLKQKYDHLLSVNAQIKSQDSHNKSLLTSNRQQYNRPPTYNQYPLQVQSKVRPFQNAYGQYRSSLGSGKQNYLSNYQPQRQTIDLKSTNQRFGTTRFDQNQYSSHRRQLSSNKYQQAYRPSHQRGVSQTNNYFNQYEQFTNQMKKYYN